ncbi:MAG TPA: acyl-CoA dehydrogenase family protein [Hyphomicrobiaceae bacterium]
MEFDLSAEQKAMRDAARRFAADQLAPGYAMREREGKLDRALVQRMGELGLIAPELPEDVGGLGVDCVTAGLVIEAIAGADLNVSYVQLLGSLMGAILVAHGRPEVVHPVVRGICEGRQLVALGLTEPGAGSDAANLQLKARRTNAGYALDGEKTSISLASQADQIVVFARTGTAEERARGVSAFLVPMNAKGITTSRFDDLGSGAVGRGTIHFDAVEVPHENLLGEEGRGFSQVMQGFDFSRALIGLQCLAAARASLVETWSYIQERKAFGQPIARFQGVTEPLAEAETLLSAAELLCYKTLWLRDRGLPHTAEAAMVKWWAPKTAFETIHRCLLTHGHAGYSRDLPHQQRLRDVLGLQIGDGTEQVQKMVIAREKIGRVVLPHG